MKNNEKIDPRDLKKIEEAFEEIDSLQLTRLLEKQRKKINQNRKEKLWREAEQRAFPDKLIMASDIFKWAEDFTNTAIFKRIEKFIDHTTSWPGLGQNYERNGQSLPYLKIYSSSWG